MRKPKTALWRRWHFSKEPKEVGGHYTAIRAEGGGRALYSYLANCVPGPGPHVGGAGSHCDWSPVCRE